MEVNNGKESNSREKNFKVITDDGISIPKRHSVDFPFI